MLTGSSKKGRFTNEVIMSQTQASVWSYRTQSDTERRTVGPRSVTLNSYRQTTASLHFCCWPDDQRETLSKNNHGDKKKYLYQKNETTIQKKDGLYWINILWMLKNKQRPIYKREERDKKKTREKTSPKTN